MGRTEKLKAQITIDCVCLRLIATVSLASVHNNHNDRRSQTLVPFVLHRRERFVATYQRSKSVIVKVIVHCICSVTWNSYKKLYIIAFHEINTGAKQ